MNVQLHAAIDGAIVGAILGALIATVQYLIKRRRVRTGEKQ